MSQRGRGRRRGLCYKFQKGKCNRGASCRYRHELAPAAAAEQQRLYKFIGNDLLANQTRLRSGAATVAALRRDVEPGLRQVGLRLPAGTRYADVVFEVQDEDGDFWQLHDGSFADFAPGTAVRLRLSVAVGGQLLGTWSNNISPDAAIPVVNFNI